MTEKQLIQYKVLCDDYEEIRRILFEIIETGEEIEGYTQIQEWVNNLYTENKQLKSFKANVKEVLKHEYEGYEDKVWGTWIRSLSLRLGVDIND